MNGNERSMELRKRRSLRSCARIQMVVKKGSKIQAANFQTPRAAASAPASAPEGVRHVAHPAAATPRVGRHQKYFRQDGDWPGNLAFPILPFSDRPSTGDAHETREFIEGQPQGQPGSP